MQRVTHQHIAERAGVSRTVVTEALHGSNGARISEETRREIRVIARQLGYQPRNRTTHTIGCILPLRSLEAGSGVSLLRQLEQELHKHRYRLTIFNADEERLASLADFVNAKTVDGVIFQEWYGGRIANVLPREVPWVLSTVEDAIDEDVDLVIFDTVRSAMAITDYLLGLGHRRLCLIMNRPSVAYHCHQKRGVEAALRGAGLTGTSLQVMEVETDAEINGRLPVVMRQPEAPTAVITVSATQAMTALYALRVNGIRVPDQVSIISAVDYPRLEAFDPQISAMALPQAEVAQQLVQRLLAKIKDSEIEPRHIRIPGHIVERASVGPAPR